MRSEEGRGEGGEEGRGEGGESRVRELGDRCLGERKRWERESSVGSGWQRERGGVVL